jgi:hypothetical protein
MATCQEDSALTKKLDNAVKTLFMEFFFFLKKIKIHAMVCLENHSWVGYCILMGLWIGTVP